MYFSLEDNTFSNVCKEIATTRVRLSSSLQVPLCLVDLKQYVEKSCFANCCLHFLEAEAMRSISFKKECITHGHNLSCVWGREPRGIGVFAHNLVSFLQVAMADSSAVGTPLLTEHLLTKVSDCNGLDVSIVQEHPTICKPEPICVEEVSSTMLPPVCPGTNDREKGPPSNSSICEYYGFVFAFRI